MTSGADEPISALTYATPGRGGGSPVAAGVSVMLGGLVLIFFGGCFCIGLLVLTSPQLFGGGPPTGGRMTWEQRALMMTLFALAITCFVAGAWVMSIGVRKLLTVGR